MSEHWIILVPDSPRFVPPKEAQERTIAAFKLLAPEADEIKAKIRDEVEFIDCGENFESVACPTCRRQLDINWWHDRMDEDSKTNFALRTVVLPCCHSQHNLNELIYEWPQGFARFSIEAMNANIGELSAENRIEFESLLGCSLRIIYRHI